MRCGASLISSQVFTLYLRLSRDGADLAKTIAKHIDASDANWQRGVKGFEAVMQRRALSAAKEAMGNMDTFIAEGDAAWGASIVLRALSVPGNAWRSVRRFVHSWTSWIS